MHELGPRSPAAAPTEADPRWRPSRRELIGLGGATLLGGGIAAALRHWTRHEGGLRAEVFIAKAADYDADLVGLLRESLSAIGISRSEVRGKRILLKPNLVETAVGQPHINTNPALVTAAAETFRQLDAADVFVGEAQGHRRDSDLVLEESGMGAAMDAARLDFVDLNHDDVAAVKNRSHRTTLEKLQLPKTLLGADWVVTMPKLKTHHWAGVTCAMKNLFGVMPGVAYGWPKNIFHAEGIAKSIIDITAAVRPKLSIVDGIVGMEGDGPIMGTPKHAGCVIVGRNATAVDATATRVMGLNPYGVAYLAEASGFLGPIHEWNIAQRGEPIASVATRFAVLDVPHLRGIAVG